MKMGRFISLVDWLACLLILILHHKVAYSSPSSLHANFSSSSAHRCSHEESFALLQLKTTFIINPDASVGCEAIGGRPCTYRMGCRRLASSIPMTEYKKRRSFPKTEHWKEGSDCCSWDGVTCDEISGHVIELDLNCSQLQGPIDSNSSLFQLRHLQSLNLAFNNFTESKISSEFGQFAGLTHLNLSHSGFSGAIPLEISNLSKLVSLDLSRNYGFSPQFDSKFFSDLEQLEFLDLSANELEGQIPNSLSNLKKLKVLRLDSNGFRGGFPSSFANLSQLNHLSISSNGLTGNIPANTSGFQLISVMDLSFNSFNGTLPAWLFNRPSLVTLDLAYNQLTGEIPPRIGNLLNLTNLILSSNSFNGTLPAWLFNRPSLVTLDLAHNQLTGEIPSALLALPSLTSLDLSVNKLTGHIAEFQSNLLEHIDLSNNDLQGANFSSISNLVNLTALDLSSNNLTGTLELDVFSHLQKLSDVDLSYNIHLSANSSNKVHSPLPELVSFRMSTCNVSSFPYFLKNFIQLSKFDLSNNKIRGPIPEWLGIMGKSSLTFLNLSHNLLTSSVEILPWGNLTYLDLSFNLLQGTLPVPASTTEYYYISNNKISGKIHPGICNLSVLELVNFSNNSLSGTIPDCLSNITSLEVLDLRHNNLSGTIPKMVGDELIILDLSHNQLEGQLPRSLANCTELELLDLSYNFIFDTFPSWLETLPELEVLKLRSNRFYGSIANSRNASSFAKLHIIDLSYNKFSGNLPSHYFRTWKSMMMMASDNSSSSSLRYYSYSMILTNKGQEMELVPRLIILVKAIDFSNNKFEGKIPESIGNLKSLIVLNLSNNGLTGEIPTSLGNLTQLESLDFSNNKLSGRIPEQLSSLTFLEAFNVSQNNLEGPIPQTGQLLTFSNDSYIGNPGLCGIPLSKKCKDVPMPHLPIPSSEEDQNSDTILYGFNWKSVVIGYGCGTIIGMIIGHIIIKRNEEWVLSLFNIRLLWRIKKPN